MSVSPPPLQADMSAVTAGTHEEENIPQLGGCELVLKLGCWALTTSVDVQGRLRCQYFAGANEIQYLIPFVFKSLGQV